MVLQTPPNLFTAAQIAAALHRSKRGILSALQSVMPGGVLIVNGQQANAWPWETLPAALQQQLQARAQQSHCRDAGQLLAAPAPQWQPRQPLNQIAESGLTKAAKVQRALVPMLERLNDLTVTEAEFAAQGVEHYRREFGHTISERHWRTLWARVLERDRGAENWARLELYLDESPALKNAQATADVGTVLENHQLARVITAFKNPSKPTPREIEFLWLTAFELLENQAADGKAPKKARRALIKFLWDRASFLADSLDGLRRQFERKHAKWLASDKAAAAIADQRAERSGFFRAPKLSQADKDTLTGHAVLSYGGRVSQAWRELVASGELSEELMEHYQHNPASKSHVPRHIRDAVKTDIALLETLHHGPRQAQLNGAHLFRNWKGVCAGDWYQADDCTLPIYYYEPDGKGWFQLWRGQFLLMIDVRSLRVLGFALLSSRNYNSLAIRSLITRTCDEHGLPRKGFYFENGIWKNSKILTGDKSPFSLPEAEKGLRDLGIKFVHAKLPRAKVVERVLGMMQDLMEGYPGYCGRDERHDRFERVQKAMLQVNNRKLDPAGHFLNADEWLTALEELCVKYNAAIQNGKLIGGYCPDAAWQRLANADDPQVRFDASCRYLLAHHRRPVKVSKNGITLTFGTKQFNYRNEQTGRLIGQKVLTWFNPDAPEILSVTDLDRQNPFAVARSQEIPAMDASPELMQQEMGRIAAHQGYAKSYYRTLKSTYARPFRRNLVDPETAVLGDSFQRQGEAAKAQNRQVEILDRRARRAAKDLNLVLSPGDVRNESKISAAEKIAELLNEPDTQT